MDAQVAPEALDRIVLQIAVAAVELERPVDDRRAAVGREPLRHGREARLVRRILRHLHRRRVEQHPRRLQLGLHVGEGELGVLEIGDGLAELLAVLRIGDRLVETALRPAQRTGADIEPTAVQPHHRDAEALALAADQILRRHAHPVEIDLRGRLRMPAQLLLIGAEADARHVLLDHEAGNALRPVHAGAHHADINLVLAAARDELLCAGDDIMVAVLHRLGLQRGGVGAGARLGQAIGADPLHRHHRRKILLLHRLRAEAVDHPRRHVVDRDEGAGRGAAIGHGLHDQSRLQPPQPDAARFLGHIDRAEAQLRGRADRVAREDMLLVPLGRVRRDRIGGELPRHILDLALLVGEVELVGHSRAPIRCVGFDCSQLLGRSRAISR